MKKPTKQDKRFVQGFTAACAILQEQEGNSTLVENVYCCNYMTIEQLRAHDVEESDIEILSELIGDIEGKRDRSANQFMKNFNTSNGFCPQ